MKETQKPGTTIAHHLNPAEVEKIEKMYEIRNPAEIWDFIEKYPFLVAVLLEAPEQIVKHFPRSPLFLECVTDPEIDNPVLMVYVGTSCEPESAMDRLDRLDDWWVKLPYQIRENMCIDVEFQ